MNSIPHKLNFMIT